MKRLFALIVALFSLSAVNAQTQQDSIFKTFKRPLFLSTSFGKTISFGEDDNEYWFGKQPAVYNEFAFRLTYFVVSHWGIYADLYFGPNGEWTPPIDVKWRYEEACGLYLSAGMGIGCMYRYEHKRWQLFTRAGIGACTIAYASDLIYHIGYDDNIRFEDYKEPLSVNVVSASRITSPSYINLGVTGGYRLSRGISLILDLNYRYPISSSKVKISYETTWLDSALPQVTNSKTYTSRSWGNNLTVSVGIQLQCELSRNK